MIEVPKSIGFYFDPYETIFYSLSENHLTRYSFIEKEIKIDALSQKNPFEKGDLYKDHYNNELLFTWSGGGAEISKYDFESTRWSQIDNKKRSDQYFNAGVFLNPLDSNLYKFGGYGHYTFKNDLQRFNKKTNSWEIIPLTGDTITPRKPMLSNIVADSLIFIGGGKGSRSGDQSVESRSFSDLYVMNLKNFHTKKVGDLIDLEINQHLENFYYDEHFNELYFLLVSKIDSVSILQMYKYNFERDSSYEVGNELKFPTTNRAGNIYYSFDTNKIYFITVNTMRNQNVEFEFYNIQLPVLSDFQMDAFIKKRSGFNYNIYLIVAFFGSIMFLVLKRKRKKYQPSSILNNYHSSNKILVLGEFKLYDRSSKNIAPNFSTKTLEAFILLLINSIRIDKYLSDEGISSTEFANTLWPDYDKDSQKNNRNVTINKLRHILNDVEGLNIIYQNSRWKIKIVNNFFVDILKLDSVFVQAEVENLLNFLDQNTICEFCKNVSYPWLDIVKINLNHYLYDNIVKLYEDNRSKLSSKSIMKIGKSLLSIDELSEFGITLVIFAQKESGNENGFHKEFTLFQKSFEEITGENFKKTPDELIKLYF
ncbi:MAG TPA: hypothetical protein ENN33_01765 [Ignavibacteria bacterium]|nr:hypothetical protein [Ignavibacteria bacterium]